MLKLTLLSISFLTVFGSVAIAPALAEIALTFPDIPTTQIKSLLTAPALAMLIFSPYVAKLSHAFGTKRVLLWALGCYILGGLGGAVAPEFYSLFACRMLLGVGIGLLMPLASALIAQYYEGRERLQLMGWASSATNSFGIVGSLFVGFVALYNWRFGLLVYAIAVISLILVIRYIPSRSQHDDEQSRPAKLPRHAYLWGVAMLLFMLAIYAVPVNIALFVVESDLGGPRESGMAMSCLSAAAILAGLLGVRARALCGDFFFPVMLGLMIVGYLLMLNNPSLLELLFALLIIGLGSGSLLPYLIFAATSSVPSSSAIGVMGIIATAASLGQFVTPLVWDGLALALGDNSSRFIFELVAISCSIALLLILIVKWHAKQKI